MFSVEHVDLHALHRRKVRLGYTPDILTDAGENNHKAKHDPKINLFFKVADVSVMLALMAGRNAGKCVTLVKEGKVSQIDPLALITGSLPRPRTHRDRPVAQLQLRPVLIHRASTERKSARANAHSGIFGLRAHRPGDPIPPLLLRPHALHLRVQPVLTPRHRARSVARRAPRAALRPARRPGRARARERRALRPRAWRGGHAARRQRGFSPQDEEARRAREYIARHARRLGCARVRIARGMDLGRGPRRRRGRAPYRLGPSACAGAQVCILYSPPPPPPEAGLFFFFFFFWEECH